MSETTSHSPPPPLRDEPPGLPFLVAGVEGIGCPDCNALLEIDTTGLRACWETGEVNCRACRGVIQVLEMEKRNQQDTDVELPEPRESGR